MPRPDDIDAVANGAPTLSAWANDVADGINAVLNDIYGIAVGSDLTIDWAALDNVPATFAPTDHAADHATGGGDVLTPAAIGAWKKNSAGGGAAGGTIWTGTTDPDESAAEGDIWVKG